jgi:hypothetical protein
MLTSLRVGIAVLFAFAYLGRADPVKVRITTWNLEWFPNGSAREATPEKQAQHIEAAANALRPLNADILVLQEMRDYDACDQLDPVTTNSLLSLMSVVLRLRYK